MAKSIEKQLPPDFKNWTELYFYIKEHNIEAFENYFVSYLDFFRNENYTIEVRYLEKQVLKEILSVLPSKKAVICAINELQVGDLIWVGADIHLYNNHTEQAKEQLSRTPFDMPTIKLNPNIKDIFAFKFEDITLENYNAHPPIKAPVAI